MSDVRFLDIIDSCLATNTRKLARNMTRIYDSALETSGININQLAMLLTIQGLMQELSTKQMTIYPSLSIVATRLGMDNSTLSRNLRTLEDRSIVLIEQSKESRREKIIKLTEQGVDIALTAYPLWKKIQDLIKNKMGETKFFSLLEELTFANDVMGKILKSIGEGYSN
ncbi:MAG: winged helix-turn-helix transcriptional regulator [Candidatus Heimdallarchaeota archaeon]|nr:winged helix-turn-helix transcriptional regulator [Candidatus Heimdallarchaeota archaeon]